MLFFNRHMARPPSFPPPSPESVATSSSTLKKTRKETRLRSLATRLFWVERPMVHVDPATGKADMVDVTIDNWKQVLVAQKDLILEDI